MRSNPKINVKPLATTNSSAAKVSPLKSWKVFIADLCRRLALDLAFIPIENLLAVPVHDAFELVHIIINRFEIFDPERLAGDVGMDRQRQDFRPIRALGIEPIETVNRALEQMIALMMLHHHHRDVVEFDG